MYYGKPQPLRLAILLACSFLLAQCTSELPEVRTKEDFPKQKLEKLGDKMLLEMLHSYQFLPEIPPYDTSIYWYVQTLYGQATHAMHRDRQSPASNRWNQERPWRVFIIKSDSLLQAFALPGGDFMISTGFLKNLNTDHELYALLAFEANLMHRGHQLELLIQKYNALTLEGIADGQPMANDLTANVLASEFVGLAFDFQTVEKADAETVATICESSILDPTGLATVSDKTALQNSHWLQTRPSYGGRSSALADFAERLDGPCGDQIGLDNYQRFVLNVLD